MKLQFDVTVQEFDIIEEILANNLTNNCQVWVFGSRAKNSTLFNSDLDLALECNHKIASKVLTQLKTDFEKSKLPYRVDVLNINTVEPYFQEIINKKKILFPFKAKNKVPKLRFAEFSGAWEEKKGNKVFENISNKNHNSDLPILAITQEYGAIPRDLIDYNMPVSEKSVSSYKVVDIGDFIISLRSFQGGIEYSNYKGICSPAYIILKPKISIENRFYKYFLKTYNYIQNLNRKLEGIRDGKMISYKYFSEIKLPYPTKPEQQKIATFLTAVDTKINQLSKKQQLLNAYKKGVMQQLFPTKGKTTPKLRFPEFQNAKHWELKPLGDCLDYIQPTKYLVKNTAYNNSYPTPVLTAGKTFILGYTDETNGIFENNLPVIIFDDFTTATKFVDFPFKAKSSAMKILLTKSNNINLKFIYEAMQMIKYEVGNHERHWISKFAMIDINIPSLQEQTKIANFLSSIDDKIQQVGKQLDKSKAFKKALLQQMFV